MDAMLFAIAGFATLIAVLVVQRLNDDGDRLGAVIVGGVAALAVVATTFFALASSR